MNETPPTFPPATGLVRRLAPIETCRLMGFPDDYLDVDGAATKDAPRYKACGNSWAVNCAEWVNARIERALRESGAVAPDAPIRYATTCSGVEAHSLSVGYTHANWQPRFFSEIEPFPCRVLKYRYPSVPNLGDMTKVDGHDWPLDVFSGGTPCFTAGNMVLTESGYRPIEDIRVGDLVMSHLGRLCKVTAVGKKRARNIVDVKCSTAPRIRCTGDHKFWSPVNPHRDNRRHASTYCKTIFDGMEFRPIADIGKGGFVARLREYESVKMPRIPFAYNANTKDIIELAGWYVGDGHCAGFSEKKHKKVLLLSLNAEKVATFRARFDGILYFGITHHSQGVFRVQVANAKLCDWLVANFGHHAQNKRIPAWLIAAEPELCNAFIDGYMATDGFRNKDYSFACSTTSLALALGLSDLVGNCAIHRSKVASKKVMFDGRVVNQHDFWNVRRSANKALRFHVYDKWMNVRVSSIEKCEPETVYNITVEGDHGYIVNGVCVSNCQSVSIAGKRHGMAEGSGTRSSLAFHWLRIAGESGAKVTLWENVCFGAGTFVTTDGGYKSIEAVKVGDRVRSIDGKMHRVEKVMATKGKETVTLRVMGADAIAVTPNHPFYARTKANGKFSAPEWMPAGLLAGDCYIAYRIDEPGTKSIGLANAYAVGRWLADGSVALRDERTHNGSCGGQRARIFISTGWKKHDSLAKELARLPFSVGESKVKDYAVNFTFTSDAFYSLIRDCGKGARNKVVPEYVYSLVPEEQKELLRGYLDGDGCVHRRTEMTYSSSSRALAMGIARLVRNVYRRGVSMRFVKGAGTIEIDGRTVKAHDSWSCSFSPCEKKNKNGSFEDGGFIWCPVREVAAGKKQTVYNLTVAGTHTYEANGVVVHNCGAFSTNGGRDFAWFVHRLTEAGWGVAWRVLDAQYVFSWTFPRAIPQRRRRIWLVAVRGGDWQMAARIMFERSRESGATPPVRVLNDGTVVDADDGADAAERRFLRFGATREADWVSVRDLDEVSQFGNVLYRGPMFKSPDLFGGCEDATPDNIDPQMLAALNGGGGVAVGDIVALLKVPAWNAGIERPWALRDAEANPLPAAYDGTVCGLSDVLLPWSDDLLRLVLSQRACEGILRRAKARGKELKAVLKTALEGQIACWTAGLLRDAKGKGNAAEDAEAEDAEAATHEEEEEASNE